MPATKIATCCYCGTRAALVLRGEVRHELSCARCGAPFRRMKVLPTEAGSGPGRVTAPAAAPTRPTFAAPSQNDDRSRTPEKHMPKRDKRRKRKSLGAMIWRGLAEVADEIFD